MARRSAGERVERLNAAIAPPDFDLAALRSYRVGRLQAALAEADVDLAALTSPVSIRYAADSDQYVLFQSRIPTATYLVPREGKLAAFGAYHLGNDDVGEYASSFNLSHFDAGLDMTERARRFAEYLRGRLREAGAGSGRARVALERMDVSVVQACLQVGLEVVDAGGLIERAKSIKSEEEILLIRHAIAVAQFALDRMKEASRPGATELGIWSLLHQVNVAHGGQWIDGRMLASGARINPWLREATAKTVAAGELVALDTDLIGPFNYCADISRTWLCGDGAPSPAQRDLYQRAHAEISHNKSLVRAGLGFKEFSEKAFRQPNEFIAHRYPCLAHGVGMCDEWPKIVYRMDWERDGYDGVLEAGMVLSIESFVGSDRGGEGVKLEDMILVTETGFEPLSDYPFENHLM